MPIARLLRCHGSLRYSPVSEFQEETDSEKQRYKENEGCADRAVDEDHRIAARHQHGSPEILFHYGAEHEAEHEWGGGEIEIFERIAERSQRCDKPDVERRIVDGEHADADEGYDHRIENVVPDREQPHPEPDKGN